MAKVVGIKEIYIFPITSISPTGVPTYGTPEKLARGIDVTLSPKVAEATLYAGDVLDESVTAITSYDITMNINHLTLEHQAKLLGHKIDANGFMSFGSDDVAPEFAVAFSAPLSNGGTEYRVMYRVKFKPTDESYKTKTENIEFQTPTITGVSLFREDIHKFGGKIQDNTDKAKVVAKKWFTEVQVPLAG